MYQCSPRVPKNQSGRCELSCHSRKLFPPRWRPGTGVNRKQMGTCVENCQQRNGKGEPENQERTVPEPWAHQSSRHFLNAYCVPVTVMEAELRTLERKLGSQVFWPMQMAGQRWERPQDQITSGGPELFSLPCVGLIFRLALCHCSLIVPLDTRIYQREQTPLIQKYLAISALCIPDPIWMLQFGVVLSPKSSYSGANGKSSRAQWLEPRARWSGYWGHHLRKGLSQFQQNSDYQGKEKMVTW